MDPRYRDRSFDQPPSPEPSSRCVDFVAVGRRYTLETGLPCPYSEEDLRDWQRRVLAEVGYDDPPEYTLPAGLTEEERFAAGRPYSRFNRYLKDKQREFGEEQLRRQREMREAPPAPIHERARELDAHLERDAASVEKELGSDFLDMARTYQQQGRRQPYTPEQLLAWGRKYYESARTRHSDYPFPPEVVYAEEPTPERFRADRRNAEDFARFMQEEIERNTGWGWEQSSARRFYGL